MALYKIEHRGCTGAITVEWRRRKDAADYLLRRRVRSELIAGWAGLDTGWGWRVGREANMAGSELLSGVPVGWRAVIESGHPMHGGERITISREA